MGEKQARVVGLWAVLFLVISGGCIFQNMSPSERLKDAVIGLNDETRWTRLDLAIQRVEPTYRGTFSASRAKWGKQLQIADVELLDARFPEDSDDAVSVVSVTWYALSDMTLHTTVIKQSWTRGNSSYLLVSEDVMSGHEALLELPETDGESIAEDQKTESAAAKRSP